MSLSNLINSSRRVGVFLNGIFFGGWKSYSYCSFGASAEHKTLVSSQPTETDGCLRTKTIKPKHYSFASNRLRLCPFWVNGCHIPYPVSESFVLWSQESKNILPELKCFNMNDFSELLSWIQLASKTGRNKKDLEVRNERNLTFRNWRRCNWELLTLELIIVLWIPLSLTLMVICRSETSGLMKGGWILMWGFFLGSNTYL